MADEAKVQAERLNKAEQFLHSGNLAGLLRQQDYYNKAHYVSSPLPYGQVADLFEKQAAELAKYKALAETLAGALEKIAEGTYPRPLGKPWRMDASSSKHDRCIHDAWMYETCEGCLDAFVAETLLQYKEATHD